MAAILSEEDCVNIVKYVSWLEDRLEKEAGCYYAAVKDEIEEEYKKNELSLDKIVKGQFH